MSGRQEIHKQEGTIGAIATEHSSSELRVIGTNAHRVDSYFLHLSMHIQTNSSMYVCSSVNP